MRSASASEKVVKVPASSVKKESSICERQTKRGEGCPPFSQQVNKVRVKNVGFMQWFNGLGHDEITTSHKDHISRRKPERQMI